MKILICYIDSINRYDSNPPTSDSDDSDYSYDSEYDEEGSGEEEEDKEARERREQRKEKRKDQENKKQKRKSKSAKTVVGIFIENVFANLNRILFFLSMMAIHIWLR